MSFSGFEIAILAAAAFGTALLHSVGGFAGAVMLAVCVAPIVGVKETVPVVATAMLISHSARVWLFRGAIDWNAFRTVFAVALPFILAGIFLYIRVPETHVAIFLGGFLVVSIVLRRVLAGRDMHFGVRGLRLVAVPFGFLAGTTFGAGLLLGPFLLGAGISGEALIATVASLGLCLNVLKTVIFGLSPLLTGKLAVTGALLGLCTIPGHRAGRWIVRRTPVRVHTVILEVFMLSGAAYFLSKGIGVL